MNFKKLQFTDSNFSPINFHTCTNIFQLQSDHHLTWNWGWTLIVSTEISCIWMGHYSFINKRLKMKIYLILQCKGFPADSFILQWATADNSATTNLSLRNAIGIQVLLRRAKYRGRRCNLCTRMWFSNLDIVCSNVNSILRPDRTSQWIGKLLEIIKKATACSIKNTERKLTESTIHRRTLREKEGGTLKTSLAYSNVLSWLYRWNYDPLRLGIILQLSVNLISTLYKLTPNSQEVS